MTMHLLLNSSIQGASATQLYLEAYTAIIKRNSLSGRLYTRDIDILELKSDIYYEMGDSDPKDTVCHELFSKVNIFKDKL